MTEKAQPTGPRRTLVSSLESPIWGRTLVRQMGSMEQPVLDRWPGRGKKPCQRYDFTAGPPCPGRGAALLGGAPQSRDRTKAPVFVTVPALRSGRKNAAPRPGHGVRMPPPRHFTLDRQWFRGTYMPTT